MIYDDFFKIKDYCIPLVVPPFLALCNLHLHCCCYHAAPTTVASPPLVCCTSISCTAISCTSFSVFQLPSRRRSSKVSFQCVFILFSVLYILIFNFRWELICICIGIEIVWSVLSNFVRELGMNLRALCLKFRALNLNLREL